MKAIFKENTDLSINFKNDADLSIDFGDIIRTSEAGLLFNTTSVWNSTPDLISLKDIIYVYTDHHVSEDGQNIPGFKVGDGSAYLIDLPFNDDIVMKHISDTSIHITDDEREFWNNKVTAYLDAENLENLVLAKE